MAQQKAIIHPTKEEFYLPPDERMRAIVTPLRSTVLKGQKYDAYPHVTDVTRLARNLGYTLPSPVYVRYPWKGTEAFQTQKITSALLTMNSRAYVLSEMGTGKTRAALYAVDWMFKRSEIKKVLVAAPLSTLDQVWAYEIMRYFPELRSSTLYGSKAKRLAMLGEHAHVYIINHHGVEIMLDELREKDFDLVIIDEISGFRNKRTDLWNNMWELVKDRKYVWGMTGSPIPTAPTDAWAQIKLLTPDRTTKYFRGFKQETMTQVSQFRWIPKPNAVEIVHAAMQPAVRFKRNDCVELPPVSHSYVKVEQSKQQERVYKELMSKLAVAFAQGEVTAANEGVLFSKLLQIASGWVYTKDKQVIDLAPKQRLQQLHDTILEADAKVIVFADFIHTAEHIAEYLTSKKHNLALVTGKTPAHVRNDIFGRFQRMDSPHVLVAHPKCMAHGLTLTAANVMVWFTPTTSLETYEQACARITRPGQTQKQLIVHLTGTPVESKVYRRLKERASIQGALLDLFTETAQ